MKSKKPIERYANFFRRRLSPRLKPGIGAKCFISPAEEGGGILEFVLGSDLKDENETKPTKKSINQALRDIPQRMVGGDISAVRFSGTNISLEGNRIIIIKGDDTPSLWSGEAAKEDIERIFGILPGGTR